MKNLKKKKDREREETWGKIILNRLIGFDGLFNNIYLLNGYYWVTHLYPYAKI